MKQEAHLDQLPSAAARQAFVAERVRRETDLVAALGPKAVDLLVAISDGGIRETKALARWLRSAPSAVRASRGRLVDQLQAYLDLLEGIRTGCPPAERSVE